MNRIIGTIVLICFVVLSGWLLGCGTRVGQESAVDSERNAATDDVDQPRKKTSRKRAQLFMYA